MRILLTNDDGITSRGLFAAKKALDEVGEVSVIAPDSNRSAVGRGITIDRSLTVTEVELRDGSRGYATDGTPVDCVRFAELGLLGERPDLIVAGINYGVNLGDDVTYSGTVAAAFEGIVLGIPAIAVSQQSKEAGLHFRQQRDYDFSPAAGILATLARHVAERGLPAGDDSERERAAAAREGGRGRQARAADLPRPARARVRRSRPAPLPHLRRRPLLSRRARHRLPRDRRGQDRGHAGAPRPDERRGIEEIARWQLE